MKKKIQIKTKSRNYNIFIKKGSIDKYLKSKYIYNNKVFIIVDSKIARKIERIVKNKKKVVIITIKGSEKIKSIEVYWKIISKLLQKNNRIQLRFRKKGGLSPRKGGGV